MYNSSGCSRTRAQKLTEKGQTMLRKFFLIMLCSVVFLASPISRAEAQKQEVDLLLVLAADTSSSVSGFDYDLMIRGHAEAISHDFILKVIQGGTHGRIAVSYVEWAGWGDQSVVVGWTLIDGPEAAQKFKEKILNTSRQQIGNTIIGDAIDFCSRLFEISPYVSARKTIDIAGDGVSGDQALNLPQARESALSKGIVINGLVVAQPGQKYSKNEASLEELQTFYQEKVTGGPGSFVLTAESYEAFGLALVKKLSMEIAAR